MTDLRTQLERTLGDAYTIERELGGGGMSRVFLAADRALGRAVVVKVLPGETAGALSLERFRREIRLAASLQQANIVPVLTAGDAGGVAYYTMPFVKGESLRTHLDEKGALPVAECVAIIRDVGRALAFAHGEGIVHRDIKPENILLSGGTAVVTDFGIAKALAASSANAENATLTQAGTSLGTPAYMAPEQVVGEIVDHRADLYALGLVAYEMLAGVAPFAGRSAQAMLAAQVMETPVSLAEKCPDAPAELVALVMQCLAKEPAARPESATAALAALDAITAPQPVIERAPSREVPSIAVLPFENLSPDPADEYFADGLTDEIITDLSSIGGLRVIARASMMRFKKTGKEPRAVAREVGARYALDGSVRRAGPSLRLTVRLTDARDAAVIWSEKINGSVEDVFAIQEQISRTIVDAMRVALTPQDAQRLNDSTRPRGANAEAIEEYLRGRHFFALATADGLAKSLASFQRATELDPSFAAAFAGFAHTSAFMTVGWQALPPRETMPKAQAAARRAVELDPRLAEAHVALGVVAAFYEWDLAAAERAFREAIRLNANYPDVFYSYAQSLMWLDTRFDEAVEHARRAVNISPLDPWALWYLGLAHYFGRNYEARIDIHHRLIALHPHWGFGYFGLGMTLSTVGRPAEATACHLRAIELDGRSPQHLAGLGASYTLSGNDAGALECLAELDAQERRGQAVWAWKLMTYAALGHADNVIRALEHAYEERASTLIIQLNHPFLDFVRVDPRFHALLRRMRLDHLISYRPTREFRRDSAAPGE
ncbi:MAG TPA: protein kinase [Gemmatimonadaceae bacterium]